jgi:hypothetical protein
MEWSMCVIDHPIGEIANIEVFADLEIEERDDSFSYSYGSVEAIHDLRYAHIDLGGVYMEIGGKSYQIDIPEAVRYAIEANLIKKGDLI